MKEFKNDLDNKFEKENENEQNEENEMQETKKGGKQALFYLQQDYIDFVEAVAKKYGKSKSQVIRDAIDIFAYFLKKMQSYEKTSSIDSFIDEIKDIHKAKSIEAFLNNLK